MLNAISCARVGYEILFLLENPAEGIANL